MRLVTRLATGVGAMLIVGFGAPPAEAQVPAGTISVDDTGQFLRDGQATISGSYSCEEGSGFAFITGNLVQPVGRLAPVRGEFITESGLHRRDRELDRRGAGSRQVQGWPCRRIRQPHGVPRHRLRLHRRNDRGHPPAAVTPPSRTYSGYPAMRRGQPDGRH